jgi:hypothetical protein
VILEAVVTTLGPTGAVNLAPMGPRVEPGSDRFVLRPFRTSTTYQNLSRSGQGVLHVTDDVLTIARASIGDVPDAPVRPAERVEGMVWTGCCRYEEFRVIEADDRGDRPSFVAESVHRVRLRDFFGFNRARHAVLEAAILATRVHLLPPDEVLEEVARHRVVVEKTGGPAEREALDLLERYVRARAQARAPGGGVAG